jgi:hypothetical protein
MLGQYFIVQLYRYLSILNPDARYGYRIAGVMCSGMVHNLIKILTSTVSLSGFRIFAHNDQAGQAAADRWTEQLKDGATVDRFGSRANILVVVGP